MKNGIPENVIEFLQFIVEMMSVVKYDEGFTKLHLRTFQCEFKKHELQEKLCGKNDNNNAIVCPNIVLKFVFGSNDCESLLMESCRTIIDVINGQIELAVQMQHFEYVGSSVYENIKTFINFLSLEWNINLNTSNNSAYSNLVRNTIDKILFSNMNLNHHRRNEFLVKVLLDLCQYLPAKIESIEYVLKKLHVFMKRLDSSVVPNVVYDSLYDFEASHYLMNFLKRALISFSATPTPTQHEQKMQWKHSLVDMQTVLPKDKFSVINYKLTQLIANLNAILF